MASSLIKNTSPLTFFTFINESYSLKDVDGVTKFDAGQCHKWAQLLLQDNKNSIKH